MIFAIVQRGEFVDPLSDVLSLVKVHSFWSLGFEWGGPWCLEFGAYDGIRIYASVFGSCWLSVDGVSEPIRGEAGDCLLLPSGRPYRVGSDLALPPVDAADVLVENGKGGITTYNHGGDFMGIGGHFNLAGDQAGLLIDLLPPVLHIRRDSDKAVLRWTLERLRQELHDPQPGGSLAAQYLATMLLIQALRVYLTECARDGVGWLFALADRRMRVALTAMHDNAAYRWTVQALAKQAGMSRTAFAIRFRETVGKSPLEYLTHWRMQLAADRFANTDDSIAVVAPLLGYESLSAFSTAFKRVMGHSPRQHRR